MGTIIKPHNEGTFNIERFRTLCSVPVPQKQGSYYLMREGMITSVTTESEVCELLIRTGDGRFIVPFAVARRQAGKLKPLAEPVSFLIKPEFSLHDYQAEDMVLIKRHLDELGHVYFNARPAYGKTIMVFHLIVYLRQPTVIVLPTIPLVQQTYRGILAKFSIDPARIAILELGEPILPTVDILIAYVGRLCSRPAENSGLERFTFAVFDEVHMLTSPGYLCGLMNLRPSRVAAFTATKGKRHDISMLFAGHQVLRGALSKKWTICFPSIVTGVDKAQVTALSRGSKTAGLADYTNTISLLVESPSFRNAIITLAKFFVAQNKRVMIITMRKDMTEALFETLALDARRSSAPGKARGANASSKALETNSTKPYVVDYLDYKKNECGNCDILLGTHKKIGTGFDEMNSIVDFEGDAASVLIFIGSIKDETLMYQLSGRVFRHKDPLVIFPHFVDIPFSTRHVEMMKEIAAVSFADECVISDELSTALEHVMRVEGSQKAVAE